MSRRFYPRSEKKDPKPIIKDCVRCTRSNGTVFRNCEICRVQKRRYQTSEKGRARNHRYQISEKGLIRNARDRYNKIMERRLYGQIGNRTLRGLALFTRITGVTNFAFPCR